MAEQIYIAVDGGGTNCRAVVATKNAVLGQGHAGPANVSSDLNIALASLQAAIAQALVAAGLGNLDDAFAHVGLAGVLTDDHVTAVANAMTCRKTAVTDDKPTMLTGALGGKDGIVGAIGTGSFIGSKRSAAYRYIGGWGLVLSDESSAAWLGRLALAETLLVEDGMRGATGFSDAVLAQFGNDPREIVAFAATATPAEFGVYAPHVTDAAHSGDAFAIEIMQRGAEYIERAFKALNPKPDDILCLTGGLGPSYTPYLSPDIRQHLRPAAGTALDGALTLARSMA